ncbi:MAG TPA: DMT family transporter [Stellaceae bacterium]|nr:DMT family transporter [Stellaceae bacterium]
MLLALLVFSAMDATSKILVQDYSPIEVGWGRFFVNLLLLLPFALRHGAHPFRTATPLVQILRGFAMVGSGVFFMAALVTMPIPDATAVSFVSPFFVTALSIPILGERVGIRRWSAVAVGFIGILVIVQPGSATFNPTSLLPMASSFCFASGLVLTRRIRSGDSALTTLLYTCGVATLVMSAMVPFVWQPLTPAALARVTLMGCLSGVAQYFLLLGYQRAPASLLAPFSYVQIITSTFWGAVLFHTWPEPSTWVGSAIVVASGIYVLHRERVVKRP